MTANLDARLADGDALSALDAILRQRDDDTSVRRYAAAALAFLAKYGDEVRAALATTPAPTEIDVERLTRAMYAAGDGHRRWIDEAIEQQAEWIAAEYAKLSEAVDHNPLPLFGQQLYARGGGPEITQED